MKHELVEWLCIVLIVVWLCVQTLANKLLVSRNLLVTLKARQATHASRPFF